MTDVMTVVLSLTHAATRGHDEGEATMNVQTHTGKVHAARTDAARGVLVPACRKATDLHYAIPTDAPVTCGYCLRAAAPAVRADADPAERAAARAAKRAADKAARAAADVERAARRRVHLDEQIAFLARRVDEMIADGGDDRLAACTAALAEARAEREAI